MNNRPPTELKDAQKAALRLLGKNAAVAFEVKQGGLTPEFYAKLDGYFREHDLAKIRLLGAPRPVRATLIAHIVKNGACQFVSADDAVALFHRAK